MVLRRRRRAGGFVYDMYRCAKQQRRADTGIASLPVSALFFLPPTDLNWPLFTHFGILSYFNTPNSDAGTTNATHLRKDR